MVALVVIICAAASPVAAQADYELRLDTVSADPGRLIEIDVELTNAAAVSGFNLLIGYDPSTLFPQGVGPDDTRAEHFEIFEYTFDENGISGNVRLIGVADDGSGVDPGPVPAGDGAIVTFAFRIVNDIDFAGYWVLIWFEFADPLTLDDNTLADAFGTKIEQTEIDYYDGWVYIESPGEVLLGDINLNGIPYEVSDYVYFTNHILLPTIYPFNSLQLANSDMNEDGVEDTIADLVTLIDAIISGAMLVAGQGEPALPASIMLNAAAGETVLSYNSDFGVGGLLVELECDRPVTASEITCHQSQMQMDVLSSGSLVRVFVYSRDGAAMPSGECPVLSLDGVSDATISRVDMASADGHTAAAIYAGTHAVPDAFELNQNYPNPFNPRTSIEFALSEPGWVTLTVFDMLGRRVATLTDQEYVTGRHQVTFDGRTVGAASGVYFYRLLTDHGSVTRKMVLMK